jgi:hypothetical protein
MKKLTVRSGISMWRVQEDWVSVFPTTEKSPRGVGSFRCSDGIEVESDRCVLPVTVSDGSREVAGGEVAL